MDQAVYDTAAYVMRYFFVLIIGAILLGMVLVSIREIRERKRVLGEVGRYIGYLEVTEGPEEMLGVRIGLTKENTVGSSRRADILIRDPSVLKTHALVYEQDEKVTLSPMANGVTQINGRRAVRPHQICTGDRIRFGDIETVVFVKEREVEEDDD